LKKNKPKKMNDNESKRQKMNEEKVSLSNFVADNEGNVFFDGN
jgi:hypothetical protein